MQKLKLNQFFDYVVSDKKSWLIQADDCIELITHDGIYGWYQTMLQRGQYDEADTFKSLMLHVHRN